MTYHGNRMRLPFAFLLMLCCATPAQSLPASSIDISALQDAVLSDLNAIATSSVVIASVSSQNAKYQSLTDDEINAIRALWHGEQLIKDRPLITGVIDGPAAHHLQKVARETKSGSPFFVSDMRGLVVAATEQPDDYRLTSEPLWEHVFLAGPDRIVITPTSADPSKPMWVSVGIYDPRKKVMVGVVSTLRNVPRSTFVEDEESDEFEMRRPEELIYGAYPFDPVPGVNQNTRITGKTSGVAGN